jgi:phosphopantetheinyl transferase
VAKDAVREHLRQRHGMVLCPADIEIGQDEHGRPVPQGSWTQEVAIVPALSLTHTDGIAVAMVGHGSNGGGLGIDLDAIRRLTPGFNALVFSQDERGLLASLPSLAHEEWVMRLWCAKEAAAKALGRGLIEGPQSLKVQEIDTQTGIVKVAVRGKLAEAFPEFAAHLITTYTAREGNYVMASTHCQGRTP